MEAIIYLLLIAGAIYLLYLLVRYVIAPIAGIVGIVIAAAATIYALIVSCKSFFPTAYEHRNPYDDPTDPYIDKHKDAIKGVRRGYFFGPGLHQLKAIVRDSFVELSLSLDNVKAWKERVKTDHPSKFITIPVTIFYVLTFLLTYVFGGIWVSIFSVILSVVLFIGMIVFFLFFSVLWIADRLYLLLHSIQSRCPECHRVSIVPIFICDKCGEEHRKLTPGPYGIFKRTCSCGNVLPTTVFSGRSRLEALCPHDYTPLAASDAKQIGIQLVGSTQSGKTTYLASFWHCFNERAKSYNTIRVKYSPDNLFSLLETTFQSGDRFDATKKMNAEMYSAVLEEDGQIPLQFSIYDIAGEAFDNLETNQQQEQFSYCEGIMFVVDPSDDPALATSCISLFITNFESLKGITASKVVSLPVAVLITKADMFRREIGPTKTKVEHGKLIKEATDPENVPTYQEARSNICRRFLLDHDFGQVVDTLEAKFHDVKYYPVSAIGHEPNMEIYEPWGVMEPMADILSRAKAWKNSSYNIILKGVSK